MGSSLSSKSSREEENAVSPCSEEEWVREVQWCGQSETIYVHDFLIFKVVPSEGEAYFYSIEKTNPDRQVSPIRIRKGHILAAIKEKYADGNPRGYHVITRKQLKVRKPGFRFQPFHAYILANFDTPWSLSDNCQHFAAKVFQLAQLQASAIPEANKYRSCPIGFDVPFPDQTCKSKVTIKLAEMNAAIAELHSQSTHAGNSCDARTITGGEKAHDPSFIASSSKDPKGSRHSQSTHAGKSCDARTIAADEEAHALSSIASSCSAATSSFSKDPKGAPAQDRLEAPAPFAKVAEMDEVVTNSRSQSTHAGKSCDARTITGGEKAHDPSSITSSSKDPKGSRAQDRLEAPAPFAQVAEMDEVVIKSAEIDPKRTPVSGYAVSQTVEPHQRDRFRLLRYSRHPQSLSDTLLKGERMEPLRKSLIDAGYPCTHASGARIFVKSEDYEQVRKQCDQSKLGPTDVIVDKEWAPELQEAVSKGVPHRDNVKLKSNDTFPLQQQPNMLPLQKSRPKHWFVDYTEEENEDNFADWMKVDTHGVDLH